MKKPWFYVTNIVSFLLIIGLSSPAWGSNCSKNLDPNQYFRPQQDGKILFGPGASTRAYPKDYTLKNMGLTEQQISAIKGDVVLVGEGYGSLLPLFLKAPDAHVVAVDPIYGLNPTPSGFMGEGLAEFVAKYSANLSSASADHLPKPANAVDFLFSHLLINNLMDVTTDSENEEIYDFSDLAINTVRDAIRVLKPGGKAVFVAYSEEAELKHLMELVAVQGTEHRYSFRIESFNHMTDYNTFGSLAPDKQGTEPVEDVVSRLILEKK